MSAGWRVVAHGPDLASVHGHGVAAVAAGGDAVQAEPVALEVQRHHLLAAVRRAVDDLEEARVEDVQALETLAGLVDRVAGMHHATLDRQALGDELQAVGDALGGLVVGIGGHVGSSVERWP